MFRISRTEWQAGETLMPPLSKSDCIRQILLNHALSRPQREYANPPEDVTAVLTAIDRLSGSEESVRLNMGLGGAPLRFIAALALSEPGKRVSIDAGAALRSRPHEPLLTALREAAGVWNIECSFSGWPWRVDTRKAEYSDSLRLNVEPASSQYVSALLLMLANAIARKAVTSAVVAMTREPASAAYLDLTIEWMLSAGFAVERKGTDISVSSLVGKEFDRQPPADWSSASYLLIHAWKTGHSVLVTPGSPGADAVFPELLSKAGLAVDVNGGRMSVNGSLQQGFDFDVSAAPDLAPSVAVMALAAPEKSQLRNAAILRNKESDRLEFILDLVEQAGGRARLVNEEIEIEPADEKQKTVRIDSREDHRRVMSAACLVALGWRSVVIDDVTPVAKSFPGFWQEVAKAGIMIEEI